MSFNYYRERILPFCYRASDGVLVRAELREIVCRICKQPRYDSGTPCPNQFEGHVCGAYQNPEINPKAPPKRYRAHLDSDGNGNGDGSK